ncbi:MAG: protein phosphatase 2C domain-containing protein [Alphaproteobacteria bacterium]|nr:protein phosphatase 2C domain-containing protein [Alphaproteobacteria bacterium]
MKWQSAQAENIGGREEQQDRVHIMSDSTGGTLMIALADGMGRHGEGARAAEILVETARQGFAAVQHPVAAVPDWLSGLCATAHERINAEARRSGSDPRTTCALAYLDGRGGVGASIGDSRIYFFRNGTVVRRSRDDSVVQILVDLGEVAESDMAVHPDQNRLLRSVGGGSPCAPTTIAATAAEFDGVLLCSDGLWTAITSSEMASALGGDDLALAADKLVRLAQERGGSDGDNVSVALARPARPTPQLTAPPAAGPGEPPVPGTPRASAAPNAPSAGGAATSAPTTPPESDRARQSARRDTTRGMIDRRAPVWPPQAQAPTRPRRRHQRRLRLRTMDWFTALMLVLIALVLGVAAVAYLGSG